MADFRLRFAPSPTGKLHVGGARTALFNWLFARANKGEYLLRIEDTDSARSSEENVRYILEGLKFLGLDDFDQPPLYQSRRLEEYRQAVEQLLNTGKAYRCFCQPEQLEKEREESIRRTGGWKYPGACRNLTLEENHRRLVRGEEFAVRFKIDSEAVEYRDLVRGDIKVDGNEIEDFVILRRDRSPTYMLAVVVDDYEMKITHVIRGDDHLSNTPKQILLLQALGGKTPQYAHIPLIFGPDKKRLSKRHGAVSVLEYQEMGILGEALRNYLALLGWNPGDEREIMTTEEIIASFSLDRINKSPAIFDIEKLEWMNARYIMNMESDKLADRCLEWLRLYGADLNLNIGTLEYFRSVVRLLQTRMRRLSEIFTIFDYFFADPASYDEKGVGKHFKPKWLPKKLKIIRDDLLHLSDFNAGELEKLLRRRAEEWGIGAGKIFHPLRMALTGQTASPGLFEMMEVLGKDCAIRRIEAGLKFLKNLNS